MLFPPKELCSTTNSRLELPKVFWKFVLSLIYNYLNNTVIMCFSLYRESFLKPLSS